MLSVWILLRTQFVNFIRFSFFFFSAVRILLYYSLAESTQYIFIIYTTYHLWIVFVLNTISLTLKVIGAIFVCVLQWWKQMKSCLCLIAFNHRSVAYRPPFIIITSGWMIMQSFKDFEAEIANKSEIGWCWVQQQWLTWPKKDQIKPPITSARHHWNHHHEKS